MFFNIILLGIVSFLNDVSTELIAPILPMFLTSLGAGSLAVGLIGGLRDSIASVLKVFTGVWSDRLGKSKIFVGSGYFTSSVFRLLLPFSRIWPNALVLISGERIGKGLRTAPRDAIIADSMPQCRGKGFGIHRTLDTLGAILGSAICFILFWARGLEFKETILIAAILGFLALIPLFWVKEKRRLPQKITIKIGLKELPKEARVFIRIASIFALSNFSYMFFILKASEAFQSPIPDSFRVGAAFASTKLAIGVPILLYILFNIFYALGAIPFGVLSDRIGKKRVIGIGYFLFVLTCIGFAFANSLGAFTILFALYGLVYAAVDGNQRALISELAPGNLKATALGAFHTSIGLVALLSSLLAGGLWQISPSLTFGFGGAVSFISAISLLTFR